MLRGTGSGATRVGHPPAGSAALGSVRGSHPHLHPVTYWLGVNWLYFQSLTGVMANVPHAFCSRAVESDRSRSRAPAMQRIVPTWSRQLASRTAM